MARTLLLAIAVSAATVLAAPAPAPAPAPDAASAQVAGEVVYTFTATERGLRCRSENQPGASVVRVYNTGDDVPFVCQTLDGWWRTSDGCYVNNNKLHPHHKAVSEGFGPGGGSGYGRRSLAKRAICWDLYPQGTDNVPVTNESDE